MASSETNEMLAVAAAACEDKKAEDIRILALDPSESGLTDYFLICNGTNERQNVAIADEIELQLKKKFGAYANSVEGRRQAEWILLDYVDFIVHIFSPEKRAFYGLERLRKTATTLSLDDLNAELKKQITATRKAAPVKSAATPMKSAAAPAKKAATKTVAKTTVAKKSTKSPAEKAVVKKPVAKKAAVKSARKS
ncbi:ribosome silencing factor [Granulicella cerasi]|uniref:Ribosomal silencing factor RsfS n=1 Tax=Granulicella cerasi TaxID=741063 RepID=A0ABW1ZAU4_9BACT|nr:ribosome silencing factor [Granulicella cerasi]